MAKLVSKTYGDALFAAAREAGRLAETAEEAESVRALLAENPRLYTLMAHPGIARDEKIAVVKEIFGGRVSDEMTGTLCMLTEKEHFADTDDVLSYFLECFDADQKIGTAYVTSAMALTKAQKEALMQKLLETTEYVQMRMHYDVDSALLGGMVVRIGNRVADSSVRTKLSNLTHQLMQIQLKGEEGV